MSTMPPSVPPVQGASPGLDPNTHALVVPLAGVSGWLKFLGVLSIIGGVLTVLTIWGIIIAWLPIWLGILQFQAGSRLRDGCDAQSLLLCEQGTRKLALFIKVQGIMVLVMILLYALGLVLFLAAMFAGMAANW